MRLPLLFGISPEAIEYSFETVSFEERRLMKLPLLLWDYRQRR